MMRNNDVGYAQLTELATGRCTNPWTILGLHTTGKPTGLIVRVFIPGATTVELYDIRRKKMLGEMSRIHDAGVFSIELKRRRVPFLYQLRVDDHYDCVDAYQFPVYLDEQRCYWFNEGTLEEPASFLGAHTMTCSGVSGVQFSVWAPNAGRVSVVGDFNHWDGRIHVMRKHAESGIWSIFIPGVDVGAAYKFELLDASGTLLPLKADPYARSMEPAPGNASRVAAISEYRWGDTSWMAARGLFNRYEQAMSIYEVHAGSWQRQGGEEGDYLSYRELGEKLIPYVKSLGFTHIQFMPLSEYPFDGSWGYQPIGLFSPTSRFGSADDFRALVDGCHRAGIGVLVDWVPAHFPSDAHGLGRFDGTCLYEHEDPRKGFHPDWNTYIYNLGRPEVVSFLMGSAMTWLADFHLDGLRVDAVSSMLYLDYGREDGQWIPNERGGNENDEAVAFLRDLNTRVHAKFPGVLMIAEESTAWAGVSKPVHAGGLGFGYKWNMGWMNDSLAYMQRDPVHKKYHHGEMTFSTVYAWDENFILSLSHDEVVHGKGSLINKMPGDEWQKFANLRAYYAFMWFHPGKKLVFMGSEFAQWEEWNHDTGLRWSSAQGALNSGVKALMTDLNQIYVSDARLHVSDHQCSGFNWVQSDRANDSVFAFTRHCEGRGPLLFVVNFTPVHHRAYQVGVPSSGNYRELLNTDALEYGGSGQGNLGASIATNNPWDNHPCSLTINLPPLSALAFALDNDHG